VSDRHKVAEAPPAAGGAGARQACLAPVAYSKILNWRFLQIG